MGFEGERKATLLRLMIIMMTSDREIHHRERALIKEVHLKLTGAGLSDPEMEAEIVAAGEDNRDLAGYLRDMAPGFSEAERELVIKAVFLVGLADGVFRDQEEEVLREAAATLGVSKDRLQEIVTESLTLEQD
jgi:uncharacterized tellurite resistance protein B-like protein